MPANSETFNFVISSTNYTQLTHPGDSTVTTRTSDKLKGDGYYGRSDGLHSIQYNVNGFLGKIVTQATLAVEPGTTDWFDISTTLHSNLGDSTGSDNATGSFIKNFTGNFVWIRTYVSEWTDGTINSIVLNH